MTIQGEGRHAGHLASFVRLSGCNLACSWCDTPYTWDWTRYDHDAETHRLSVAEVVDRLAELPGRIVVSGGEPLLQAPALHTLLRALPDRLFDVETNGTRPLGFTAGLWATVTCSPKIIPSAATNDAHQAEVHSSVLAVADFKLVARDEADLAAIDAWVTGHDVPWSRVWLMPEGTDADTLTSRTPWLMDAAVARGANFTTRLHTYGWGQERAR